MYPPCKYSWPNVISGCHAVTLHGIKCQDKMDLHNLHRSNHQSLKISFSMWRPWPLTYDLALAIKDIVKPSTKFLVRTRFGCQGIERQMYRFYTLNGWRGREKCNCENVNISHWKVIKVIRALQGGISDIYRVKSSLSRFDWCRPSPQSPVI